MINKSSNNFILINMKSLNDKILSLLTDNLVIILSWGINGITTLQEGNGIKFKVNGLKYSGNVTIKYDQYKKLYVITFNDKSHELYTKKLEDIITIIDNCVEKTSTYMKDVISLYYSRKKCKF